MEEKKIYLRLEKYLTILDGQIRYKKLSENETVQFVNIVDQSVTTIKNNYLQDKNRLLIDDWLHLVKALKHYFNIKKSIDPRIELKSDLDQWLLCEISKINNYLNEFKNGTI
jgi:hypothetical protein